MVNFKGNESTLLKLVMVNKFRKILAQEAEELQFRNLSQSGVLEVRHYTKDTVIGGQTQKLSVMGGINTLLNPAPTTDPFRTRKPPQYFDIYFAGMEL